MRFAILRSADDEAANVSVFRSWTIDPFLGPYGGFLLETMEFSQQVGEKKLAGTVSIPQMIKNTRRHVLGHKQVHDGIGKTHDVWTCEATEDDAAYLANLRKGWTYQRVHDDVDLKRLMTGPETAPGEMQEPVDVSQAPVQEMGPAPKRRGPSEEYRHLQAQAKELMAQGKPRINVVSPAEDLRAYVGAYANDETDAGRT
jgi:hypothetical protein